MLNLSTLKTLSTLTSDEAILSELKAEIERAEKAEARKVNEKAAKVAEYAEAHDIVMATIGEAMTSATVAEIFEAAQDALPEGFTKAKLAYALRVLWADEVVKTEGKVNTYALKA